MKNTINAKLATIDGVAKLFVESEMGQFDSFTFTLRNGKITDVKPENRKFKGQIQVIHLTTPVETTNKVTPKGNIVGAIAGGAIHFAEFKNEKSECCIKGESRDLFLKISSKPVYGNISLSGLIAIMTQRKQNKSNPKIAERLAEINNSVQTVTLSDLIAA